MFRVSFTGHRPDKLPYVDENDPSCIGLKERLEETVRALIADGADTFNSGMALGVDMWAAEIILKLKEEFPNITLTAVIPCPEQADKWGEILQGRYNGILARCDKIITTSPCYEKGCMLKRNKALVELCDILVAVFDGSRGGTMQTVNYARSQRKKIEMLTP